MTWPHTALRRWAHGQVAGWRLSTRIALLSLALLLLVQVAGFVVLRAGIDANARSGLQQELQRGEKVWQNLLAQRAQKLQQGAALLAADYGFREAVALNDAATLNSVLGNHGARIGAHITALLDTQFAPRAEGEGSQAGVLPVLQRLSPQLARQGVAVALVGAQAYQFVMVPLKAPVLVGWVVMGFPIDRSVLDEMRELSRLQVALLPQGDMAGPVPSTLAQPVAAADLRGNGDEVLLHGEHYLVRRVALGAPAGGSTAPAPATAAAQDVQAALPVQSVQAVLLGSVEQAVAPYRALQLTLAVLTALGLALFAAGSVAMARRLARPLQSLVWASERLAAGQYDTALAHTDRRDEIGDLAKAFDHMRVSIAAQQGEIRQLAYWDALTGLPNRLQFRDAVLAAVASARASHRALAVLMLDLDRFKHVNDVLGYALGDRLLQAVAQRLQQVAGAGQTVARLGGDEFALLAPGLDADGALALARRINTAFAEPLTLDEQTVDLSAGIGIATFPLHAVEADLLLSRAEVAMYAAKRRTAEAMVYDPASDSASAQTLSLLSELRRAVGAGELRLFLQPKLSLADGADAARVCGAEALVRWQHPQRGLVPPMQFIPFAEQTGFIRQLTLWMVEETARQLPALHALGVERVSVNLSTRDLLDPELPDKLDALLRRHGARPDGLCLEITESAIMDDPQRAETTLNRLSAAGYKLSIDDFGTGYSSLAYLKRLPVNELKIDKSFVMAMASDADDAKIVRSTIDLAHNLGLSVVAEGVETAEIGHALAALGCDEAQGYHYAKPMPVPDFSAWVVRQQAQQSGAVLVG